MSSRYKEFKSQIKNAKNNRDLLNDIEVQVEQALDINLIDEEERENLIGIIDYYLYHAK